MSWVTCSQPTNLRKCAGYVCPQPDRGHHQGTDHRAADTARFRAITESTLEGLAKRELNLSAIVGKSAEARERRLVPEVIEDFFVQASPLAGLDLKPIRAVQGRQGGNGRKYRLGRVPRNLWPVGKRLEPGFGKLGREYSNIVFDKEILRQDATLEWVTPGHALFEVARENAWERCRIICGGVRSSMICNLEARIASSCGGTAKDFWCIY